MANVFIFFKLHGKASFLMRQCMRFFIIWINKSFASYFKFSRYFLVYLWPSQYKLWLLWKPNNQLEEFSIYDTLTTWFRSIAFRVSLNDEKVGRTSGFSCQQSNISWYLVNKTQDANPKRANEERVKQIKICFSEDNIRVAGFLLIFKMLLRVINI